MMGTGQSNKPAFSLVEMVVSMVAMTVLMSALTLAVTIAGRAMPNPDSLFSAQLDAFHAVEQVASDITNLTTVTAKSSNMIEFKVADRNADSTPETIRYEWTGAAGASLTRKYNTDAPVTIAVDVGEFELPYEYRTESETVMQQQTTNTAESVLASFSGWTGYTPLLQNKAASLTSWVSEYFEITPPSGATSLTFTKADLWLKGSSLIPAPGVTVGVHRSLNDGTYAPASASVGAAAVVPAGSLTTTIKWIPVTFSGVTVSDPSRLDYCLVIKGTETTSASVETYYNASAPANGMYEQLTGNGGASWTIANKDKNKQDVHSAVYGYFSTTSNQPVTISRQFLQAVRVILRIGSDASTRVETSVQVLNEPEVTGL